MKSWHKMINICQVDTIVKIINLKERIPILLSRWKYQVIFTGKNQCLPTSYSQHNSFMKIKDDSKILCHGRLTNNKKSIQIACYTWSSLETIRDKFLLTKKLMKKFAERSIEQQIHLFLWHKQLRWRSIRMCTHLWEYQNLN